MTNTSRFNERKTDVETVFRRQEQRKTAIIISRESLCCSNCDLDHV